jgi:hypothetical protein
MKTPTPPDFPLSEVDSPERKSAEDLERPGLLTIRANIVQTPPLSSDFHLALKSFGKRTRTSVAEIP